MKLLFIFIDMLRPGLLNLVDQNQPESPLDVELKNWRGVIYTRCYTPAPDTPRSHACLWTSIYPKFNGCDTRQKYPKYYLYDGVRDLVNILRDNGYHLNIFESTLQTLSDKHTYIPPKISFSPQRNNAEPDNYSNGKNLSQFLETLEVKENSLTLLQFSDFHSVVDGYLDVMKHVRKYGLDVSSRILACIRENLCIDDFDLTVFYSDHGFLAMGENDGSVMRMLSDSRTQVMMFLRKKNETELSRHDKLSSIMDVFPTVLNFCGIPYDKSSIEGTDLFSGNGHNLLLFEDYLKVRATGGDVDIWGVRTDRGLACVDSMMKWTADYDLTEDEKSEFTSLLSEKASCFAQQVKAAPIKILDAGIRAPLLFYDGSAGKKSFAKRLKDSLTAIGASVHKMAVKTAKAILR